MFKNRSFQVKMVKDDPQYDVTPPLVEAIQNMTPEQLDQLQKKLMRQMAINIGAIICAKVAVAIILSAITKKLAEPNQ